MPPYADICKKGQRIIEEQNFSSISPSLSFFPSPELVIAGSSIKKMFLVLNISVLGSISAKENAFVIVSHHKNIIQPQTQTYQIAQLSEVQGKVKSLPP